MPIAPDPPPARSLHILLASALLLTVLAGCSRVSILYHTADIFIEGYADDYLELDSAQLADWQPTLRSALARHRRDELPYLARFFDTAYDGARSGFDSARVACLLEQFEHIYRRHFRIGVTAAAPLLIDLTPSQIRKLESKFAKDNQDVPRNDPASVARRDRKRAERYSESLGWWFGSVSERQKRIIAEVTESMPDTAADWMAYRSAKQARLIVLLRRGADEKSVRLYLNDWLVEYRDLPPELTRARALIKEQIIKLLTRMDESLTGEQRRHFAKRLRTLRDDFLSLQKRPHMATVRCATSG